VRVARHAERVAASQRGHDTIGHEQRVARAGP
jgi:hypothetical protein